MFFSHARAWRYIHNQFISASASIVESDFQTGWPEKFEIDESFFKASVVRYLNSGQAMRSSDRNYVIDGLYEQMISCVERPTPDNYEKACEALVMKWDVKEGNNASEATVSFLDHKCPQGAGMQVFLLMLEFYLKIPH